MELEPVVAPIPVVAAADQAADHGTVVTPAAPKTMPFHCCRRRRPRVDSLGSDHRWPAPKWTLTARTITIVDGASTMASCRTNPDWRTTGTEIWAGGHPDGGTA
uniref:(northern house mosquito) hypothetical protein n=1 Tax=Culex pipiens TaxID=7175 RepID=A0A8D8CE53_CULPI